ncbi:NAD-dependent protein deacetylase [Salinisphaera sp. Q1T1-3]|uniref:NAD-dependent protein deacetylase n=1 Tax=Salinisphaera sp. Q1T1-3 TaxID=2321229 RepID=UPI000E7087CD|nr:NAD-dependent protein deacetylase [Salinisphaera sp. Q1T1-3]RJS92360.1 NAD-dependent protein deacetylase [Salinisphaera sp. Q1T1-3]
MNGCLSEATDPLDTPHDVAMVRAFIASHRRLFVLTGAGLSTGSGIPDYRDRQGGWKGASPIQHQAFVQQLAKRRRYWARSMAGWPPVARARPNIGHRALARLGHAGRIGLLVTQNVDGLHQAAGSTSVVDLHGRLDRVVCLDCGTRVHRNEVQSTLIETNAGWLTDAEAIRPDGDIELGDVDYDRFSVPPCPMCGGVLKPDVVFFGGAVPRSRVERAWAGLAASDAVLVAGSSLMVWSGFRFVREAAARGLPVMAINRGHTRADGLLSAKIDNDCTQVLDQAID